MQAYLAVRGEDTKADGCLAGQVVAYQLHKTWKREADKSSPDPREAFGSIFLTGLREKASAIARRWIVPVGTDCIASPLA